MRKKKKISHNRPIETSPALAADLLAKGRYKEAIEAYKQLVKKQPHEEWQAALAKAYLLRAQTLADKGMYKEAAVLWENRANWCPDKELIEQYIYWLIRAGRHIRAAHLLTESTEHLPPAAIGPLQAQFGALLLAGAIEVAEAFPEEATLVKHYALVKEALGAYSQGDDKIAEESLKQIPFRSPYRDFRTILKALFIINADPNGARQLLDKVPAESPYAHFAKLIRMAGQDFESLLDGLSQLGHREQAFIAHLKGWDKAQLKLISTLLQAATKQNSHKALMEVVAAHQHFFGESDSRQFCLALLPSYPAGVKFYEKTFGSLSTYDKNRIAALSHERLGHLLKAEKHWRSHVESLKQHPKEKDNALKAALILRHLVELAEKRGEVFDDVDVPDFLAESLRLDPDDKSSYIKLIQWYKHNNDQHNYNKWVDTAVKYFPKESDILLIAMEAATRKTAFKKAAAFAKTLLKVDPINIKARQIARSSHLSHARKLIKSGKYDSARNELEQAAQFEKPSQRSGVVQINQALLELQAQGVVKPKTRKRKAKKTTAAVAKPKSTGDVAQAVELLQEGIQLAGGGLLGQFRTIVESKSQSLNPSDILPLLSGSKKNDLPSRQEMLELVSLINAYSEEGVTFLAEAVKQVKALLQKAVKLEFSPDEMLSICQCFKKLEHHDLLTKFAEQALKCWPERPAFVFYQIYGKAKGIIWQISMPEMDRLKEVAEKADQQGDKRTFLMIMEFLNPIGGGIVPFAPFDDDDFDDIEAEMEALENMDPENMTPAELMKFINLLSRLEDMGIEVPDFDIPIFPSPRQKPKKR